jgi:Holliday junction resolvasome RuvABC endonuclease subunit
MSIGILAGCPKPLFQIQPSETKLATVGTKTASKEEMIEWAVEAYPNAPWFRLRDKPGGKIIAKNEHIADALAVVHAGLETDQFAQFMTMYRSAA